MMGDTARIEKLKNISIGNIDQSGRKIYDVYARSGEFVIYSVQESGTIQGIAVIIEEEKPDDQEPTNNYQEIKGEFDKFKNKHGDLNKYAYIPL